MLERGPTLVRLAEEANVQHAAEVEAKVQAVIDDAVLFAGEEGHTTHEVQENTKILVLGLRQLFEGRISELEASGLKSLRMIANMEVRHREEQEAVQKELDELRAEHETQLHEIKEDRDFHKSRSRSFEAQLEQIQGNKHAANVQNENLKQKQAAYAQHNARLVAKHLKVEEELHQLYGSQIEDMTNSYESKLREAQEHAEFHRSRSVSFQAQMEQLHGNHYQVNKKHEELRQQFRDMQELHDSHAGRVQELEGEIQKIRSAPEAARSSYRTATEQIHDLQEEADAHTRCLQLEEEIQRLQSAHDVAVQNGNVNEAEFQLRIAELEAKHEQSTRTLEQTLAHNLRLEKAVATLEEAHSTHAGATANQEQMAAAHAQRVRELEADLAKYAERHDEFAQQAVTEATQKDQLLLRVSELEQQLALAASRDGEVATMEETSQRTAQLEQELASATAASQAHAAKCAQLKVQLEQTRAAATEGEAQGELASQLQAQLGSLVAENDDLKARLASAEEAVATAQEAQQVAAAQAAAAAAATIEAEARAAEAEAKAAEAAQAEAKPVTEAAAADTELKAKIEMDLVSPSTPQLSRPRQTQGPAAAPPATVPGLRRPLAQPTGSRLKTITSTTPSNSLKVRSAAPVTPVQRVVTGTMSPVGTTHIPTSGGQRLARPPISTPPSSAARHGPTVPLNATKAAQMRAAGPGGRTYTASSPPPNPLQPQRLQH